MEMLQVQLVLAVPYFKASANGVFRVLFGFVPPVSAVG